MSWEYYLKELIEIEKDEETSKEDKLKIRNTLKNKDNFIKFYRKILFNKLKGKKPFDDLNGKECFDELLEKYIKENIDNQIYFHPEISKEIKKQVNKKGKEIKKDYEALIKQDWNKIYNKK